MRRRTASYWTGSATRWTSAGEGVCRGGKEFLPPVFSGPHEAAPRGAAYAQPRVLTAAFARERVRARGVAQQVQRGNVLAVFRAAQHIFEPGAALPAAVDRQRTCESGVLNNLEPKDDAASGFKTSDELAQAVAASEHPSESEIAMPLTTGVYDVDYMVRAASGNAASATVSGGYTVHDLNSIPVNWGVLPERKVHDPSAEEGEGGAGTGKDGGAGTSNGVAGSSTGTGDASGAADGDKKSGAENSKAGDKGKASAASTDAQRKHKRVKLSSDGTAGKKKELLEETGPLPDRKNAFNADVLEKLVLRVPANMKEHILEDIRVRAPVSRSELPSALCFTLLNSATHINNMCFSDDVAMVGAACDDASFRVWRNDDQPLGTATGSAYHGNAGSSYTEAEEDEKMAVLRGHSSAVYGASFSPDNRFALTASADSTVRLWSLAAKSNLVVYRSHQGAPVWDVTFAPLGYYFATCSMDRTARLWSTDHMTPLRVFAGHLSDVDCVRFHPNHNYLATGSSDKTVRLWDVQSGKCVRVFTGHFRGVQCLAFSRNGRYLASSGEDQYINIWDLQAGKRLETLVGHKAMVTSLDFSQESTILASGGMDSTVRLWDMKALTEQPSTYSALSGAMADLHVSSSSMSISRAPPLRGDLPTLHCGSGVPVPLAFAIHAFRDYKHALRGGILAAAPVDASVRRRCASVRAVPTPDSRYPVRRGAGRQSVHGAGAAAADGAQVSSRRAVRRFRGGSRRLQDAPRAAAAAADREAVQCCQSQRNRGPPRTRDTAAAAAGERGLLPRVRAVRGAAGGGERLPAPGAGRADTGVASCWRRQELGGRRGALRAVDVLGGAGPATAHRGELAHKTAGLLSSEQAEGSDAPRETGAARGVQLALLRAAGHDSWAIGADVLGGTGGTSCGSCLVDSSPTAVVEVLRSNVEWLMGAPAGFKLNKPLASILGNGILLWLNLWSFIFEELSFRESIDVALALGLPLLRQAEPPAVWALLVAVEAFSGQED
ncbi:hypothetical protein ON010_g8317 [Phytophthora cinnamomi]|nr:hypothetical protein ON010_g8317 [Phytophthora cinnamomi]